MARARLALTTSKQLEESVAHALRFSGLDVEVELWADRGHRLLLFGFKLKNARGEIIQIQVEDASAEFEGVRCEEDDPSGLLATAVVPGEELLYHLPPIVFPGVAPLAGREFSALVEYTVLYRHIKGSLMRRLHQEWQCQIAVNDANGFRIRPLLANSSDSLVEEATLRQAGAGAKSGTESPIS